MIVQVPVAGRPFSTTLPVAEAHEDGCVIAPILGVAGVPGGEIITTSVEGRDIHPASEISAGTVTLTLTTDDPLGICDAVSDQMTITINAAATVDAGADQSICSSATSINITGTRGGSASTSTWSTSGTGSFGNATNQSTTYTPSAADKAAGTVNLTITTNDPAGPCGAASDFMVLTINPLPTATISYGASQLCNNAGTVSPTISNVNYGPLTGTFGSTTGLSINSSTGDINTATSTAGTYTVTYSFTNGNSCANIATTSVTIAVAATPVTIVPASASKCFGQIQQLTASGGLANANTTILIELFNGASTTFTVSGSNATATQNTTYYSEGTSSYRFVTTSNNATINYTLTNSIDLSAITSPKLTFSHICATEQTYDFGYVEYSTNGGTSWTTFPTSSYAGLGTLKNGVVSFDASSYSDWNSRFSGTSSTPTNSLWKTETINIPAVSSTFKIRFRMTTDNFTIYYGWLIDNLQISGLTLQQSPITWTPTAGLYTDAGATTAYTGTALFTVYAKPAASTIYTATATSGNGCTSSKTIGMTVNSLPVPTFSTSPGASICTGIDVTYTTQAGQFSYVWSIPGTEGTDYSITTGGTTTNSVTLKWLTTGSKTVTVNYNNSDGCPGLIAASSTTTVNTTPQPTFTAFPGVTTCGSIDVTYTTQSGQLSYVWFIPGAEGTDYQITGGGITSNSVTLKWLTTGSKTVTADYINPGGCPSVAPASSVTMVNALPEVAEIAGGASSICVNLKTPAFTDATVGGTWSILVGTTGTASIDEGGIVTGLTAGTVTVVYTYSDGTCSNSATKSLTIIGLPPVDPITGGASAICVLKSTPPFLDATAGGTWSITNGTGSASITAGGVVTGLTPGSVTVNYSINDGTCPNTASVSLAINPDIVMDETTVYSNSPVDKPICEGSTLNLYSPYGGNQYRWLKNGVLISEEQNVIIPNVTSDYAGTYFVWIYNDCNPDGYATGTTVALNPLPAPTLTGLSPVCINSTNVYTTDDGMSNYVWALSPGGEIALGGTSTDRTISVKWTAPDAQTVSVNYTDVNGCTAAVPKVLNVSVTDVPAIPSIITGVATPCQGSTQTYSVDNVSGISYDWSYSGTGATINSGQGSNSISVSYSASATSGTWKVIPSNGCGPGTESDLIITVGLLPLAPGTITGNATQCPNLTGQIYSVSPVPNATGYNWVVPAGWTITSSMPYTNSITVTTGNTGSAGNITVTPISCGPGTSSTLPVSVVAIPTAAGAITGSLVVCPGATGLTYSVGDVLYATTYTWTVPAGWIITNGQYSKSITVNAGTIGQNGDIYVVTSNQCGLNTSTQTININPVAATYNTGYITNGGTKFSDAIQLDGSGGTQWRGYLKFPLSAIPSSGANITSSTLYITNNGSVSGTETNNVRALGSTDPVTATGTTFYDAIGAGTSYNASVWSNTGTLSLLLNSTASTDIQTRLASPGYIAIGLTRGGGNVYNFYGYSGGANAPVLAVTYTTPASSKLTVAVTQPAFSVHPSTNNVSYCLNGTATALTVIASAGSGTITGYQWYSNTSALNSGGLLLTGNGATTASYTPLTSPVGTLYYYCVVTNSIGCSVASNVSGLVTINPQIDNNIVSSSKTICSGSTVGTLTGTVPTGGNLTYAYSWESNTDGTFVATGVTTQNYSPGAVTVPTLYRRIVTSDGCSHTSNVITISINPLPAQVAVEGGGPVCNSATLKATLTGPGTIYYMGTTPGRTSISDSRTIVTVTSSGTYYFRALLPTGCWGPDGSATVTIVDPPATLGTTICKDGSGELISASTCPSKTTQKSLFAGSGADVPDGVGTITWSNASGLSADDNNYVSATTNGSTHYLQATNYNFGIPADATIDGILVTIGRYVDGSAGGTDARDAVVSLIKAGTVTGNNLAYTGTGPDWPTTEGTRTYGSLTSNLWGSSWTPADLNASNFGVALSISIGNNRTAYVDYIQVTVQYMEDGILNWYTVGGTLIGTGSPFNPVGAPNSGLTDTKTPNTYSFYSECSTTIGCRTKTDFVILAPPDAPAAGSNTHTYDGVPHTISASVGLNEVVDWYDALIGGNLILTTPALTNVGSVTAYAQARNQLTGCISENRTPVTLTIESKEIIVTPTTGQSKVFGAVNPVYAYNYAPALIGSDAFTGSLSRDAGEDVGKYNITQGDLALGSNYTLTFITGVQFEIKPKEITVTPTANQSKIYGDANPVYAYNYTPALNGSDAFTGALSRDPGEDVGKYNITQGDLALGSNYTLTFTTGIQFEIKPKEITVTPTSGLSKIYGEGNPVYTYGFTPDLIGSDVFTGALSRDPGEDVGKYNITQGDLALSSNYTLTFTSGVQFEIKIKEITVTPKANQSKIYGDANPVYTYDFTPALIGSDAFTGALSRDPGEDVGKYNITQGDLALSSNYTLTFTTGVQFEIKVKEITVTPKAGQSKIFGEADPVYSYDFTPALIGSDVFTGTLSRDPGEDAGMYNITKGTLALSSNYTLTFTSGIQFEIKKKVITATAAPKTKVYGDADPELTCTFSPALNSGDYTGNMARVAGENVGDYFISKGTLTLSSNYTLSWVGANLTITLRPITVTADAKTKEIGTPDPVLTYKITFGSLAFSDTFSGSLTRDPGENIGTYAIKQGSLALSSNYTLTFVGANLTITAKSITPSVIVSPTSVQFSDQVTFTANISMGTLLISGRPHPEASVTFRVGNQEMGTVPLKVKGLDLEGKLTTVLLEKIKGQMAPGNKTVYAIFDFHDFRIKVTPNPATTNLTITPEDARVNYTGTYLGSTSDDNKSSNNARIFLRATVQDISAMRGNPDYDAFAGDIRNARVRFLKGSVPITNWLTPELVNGRDSKTGVVSANWSVDLASAQDMPKDINIEVGGSGYYVRNKPVDVSVVAFYLPTGYYVAGGGYLVNPINTDGTYAGDPGLKTNFGFVVKYKNNGANLQGNMDIIFRRSVGDVVHTYQIKSTSMTSLGVNLAPHHANTALIVSKANMTDITDPVSPVLLGSMLKLQVNLTDNGDSGENDKIGISLWNGSTLLFSSNWNGTATAQKQIGDGNLIIHSGSSFGDSYNPPDNDNREHLLSTEIGVKAYPNPFTDHVYFDLQLRTDSKVRLEIYDINGSKIATLFNDVVVAYNRYQLEYTPDNVSSGLLIYRLIVDDQIAFTGKLVHK